MKPLRFPDAVDWTQLWWIVGAVTALWGGLAGLAVEYPAFDGPYKVVNTILTAVLSALLFAAKSEKHDPEDE